MVETAKADLLARINLAVKAANEAEAVAATAHNELISRSRAVGLLLLEAKKIYPAVKDFEAFLQKVRGLKLSRAYDLLRLAGGRTTDEELKKEARDRQRKSRARKKTPTPIKPISVTGPDVTETKTTPTEKASSARYLEEFKFACRAYLPKMNARDQNEARLFVEAWCAAAKKAEAA